jgi:DNA gyrase inhibitor GyrI
MMRKSALVSAALLSLLATTGCRTPGKTPVPSELPISVVDYPATTVLVLAERGPYSDEEIGGTIERFFRYVEDRGITPQGHLLGAYYDDPKQTPVAELRYEIRIPVAPGTTAEPPFQIARQPAMKTATVVLVGPYDRIPLRYPEIKAWIRRNGWKEAPDMPLLEVYLVNPGSGVPPEEYKTEVHFPIAPAE